MYSCCLKTSPSATGFTTWSRSKKKIVLIQDVVHKYCMAFFLYIIQSERGGPGVGLLVVKRYPEVPGGQKIIDAEPVLKVRNCRNCRVLSFIHYTMPVLACKFLVAPISPLFAWKNREWLVAPIHKRGIHAPTLSTADPTRWWTTLSTTNHPFYKGSGQEYWAVFQTKWYQ